MTYYLSRISLTSVTNVDELPANVITYLLMAGLIEPCNQTRSVTCLQHYIVLPGAIRQLTSVDRIYHPVPGVRFEQVLTALEEFMNPEFSA